MRGPLSLDDVEELDLAVRTPEQCRATAARLVTWSEQPHPEDDAEVTPAMLLVHAGELLAMVGDHEAALDLYRRAIRAEGDVVPDVRCYLHHGLIAVGDVDAARRLAEEVRRSRPTDADVYLLIAEDYEAAGDLAAANRWMSLGLRWLLEGLETDSEDPPGRRATMFLRARRRIRQALGFAPDELDGLLPPP
ncbi:tetratricopeptide repeat protein [Geodermatophilus ruber]|uniref:Uncharacterized protein n=1 Tax=Geodermatophilus ruber TaxID=504800 RepID=A0A1I4H823_9ACTN|nr:hypothetical protein [Geodermatophilus ruber]SFL38462.1 hypothetical protein SAMN04488085_11081 [Geodermatophilus ruber]